MDPLWVSGVALARITSTETRTPGGPAGLHFSPRSGFRPQFLGWVELAGTEERNCLRPSWVILGEGTMRQVFSGGAGSVARACRLFAKEER